MEYVYRSIIPDGVCLPIVLLGRPTVNVGVGSEHMTMSLEFVYRLFLLVKFWAHLRQPSSLGLPKGLVGQTQTAL